LRVSEQFRPSAIPRSSHVKVRLGAFQPIRPSESSDVTEIWTDVSLEALLKAVKNEFGLRPTQEGGTILSRNSPGHRGLCSSPGRLSLAETRRSSIYSLSMSVEMSAAIFFMGSELATIVDD
jgi:hypothetical protein